MFSKLAIQFTSRTHVNVAMEELLVAESMDHWKWQGVSSGLAQCVFSYWSHKRKNGHTQGSGNHLTEDAWLGRDGDMFACSHKPACRHCIGTSLVDPLG